MSMNKSVVAKIAVVSLALMAALPAAHAAISLDRTRAIYLGDAKSISLNIINENKELPFLAQSWLENEQHQKITAPLVVLPPLQRVEAGERSVVRITKTAGAERLPQDRESLFYFNLREVPPKSSKTNVMQLALQTQIKLFYRPKAIVVPKDQVWQEKLVFHKNGSGMTIENPTPFYITLTGMAHNTLKQGGNAIADFQPMMLAPKSRETVKLRDSNLTSFVVTYINDYGGHPELHFVCNGNLCSAAPDANK
ncbi:P pilus assembly chaperone PapD [Serratia fonticola]|uniref:P pilus assembly chaperone PapD n=1 Tax=Serratia fonticola TaxID=47917 RepID=A0A559T554_SERFO|nr:P pilus assembly chaperone PapD [Serratia fonticola]TQI95225.1 P pilus assembly chaperone PapD [Serratia fonticola]TVZ69722.1 P pilus assembly chaperone PapD [Serratia fonticola]